MNNYIDANKLIDEIERRLKIVEPHKDTFESAAACRQELIWMKDFITSLQQEQLDGLDEAAEEYAPDFSNDFASKAAVEAMRDAFMAGANWDRAKMMEQPEVDLEEYISNKLRELGADLINHKPYSFNRGLNVGMTKAYADILEKINARKED